MQITSPNSDASGHNRPATSWRTVAGWILLGLVWRTLLASMAPLFPDETYYWEWSRRLQGGYFDHPPAIAFVIALGTKLFGATTLGVRFGSAIAGVVTQCSAVLIALHLGGMVAARRAAMLTTLLPLATLGLVLATPDAPLMASAMVALLCVERALAASPRSSRSTMWWCMAGVALGAAFLSKYTAVLLPAALVIACIVHPALRVRLREPGPWLASVIAIIMFAPVIRWNAMNDWVSFRFQLGHGLGTGAKGNILTRELDLIGGQLGLATPIIALLMVGAVYLACKHGWRMRAQRSTTDNGTRQFALAMLAIVPLAFFAFSATRRSVEANWPALAYPAAIALLAASSAPTAIGNWWKRGVALAFVLLAVVTVQVWRPLLPLPPRKDPIARASGWNQLAAVVDSMRTDSFLEGSVDKWVAAERYQDASALAYHLHDHPQVFSLNLNSRRNQYDLWRTAYESIRPGDGMVAAFDANPEGDARARTVGTWFRETKEGPVVALRRGSGEVAHRKIWLYRSAQDIPRSRDSLSPAREQR